MSIKSICKNMTSANKYVRDILKQYNENEDINNDYINEIIRFHPTKTIDVDNIEWLKMIQRPPFNTLALHYKYKNDNTIDDISWKYCIKNLYGRWNINKITRNWTLDVFRYVIFYGTRQEYYNTNILNINNEYLGICDNCNISTENIEVDHYPIPFIDIFNNFININKIDIFSLEFEEKNKNIWDFKDINCNIRLKWKNYHDSIAKYRFLCRSCNSSFGCYKNHKNHD